MIQFMTPVLAKPATKSPASFWQRLWSRCYRERIHDDHVPTTMILDVIDRVRGSEANLARLQVERTACRVKR